MVLNGKVYDALKSVAQVWLPAAGTLYYTLAQIWHLPAADNIVGSVVAVDTFLGIVLKISSVSYNNSDAKYSGTLSLQPGEDGTTVHLTSVDVNALLHQDQILFKIDSTALPK